MSTDPDNNIPCPNTSAIQVFDSTPVFLGDSGENDCKKKKKSRNVSFPDEDQLVTQYFEPANPWQDGKCTPNLTIQFITYPFRYIQYYYLIEHQLIQGLLESCTISTISHNLLILHMILLT